MEESVEKGYAPSSVFLTATQGFDYDLLPSGACLIHTACLNHTGGWLPISTATMAVPKPQEEKVRAAELLQGWLMQGAEGRQVAYQPSLE